MVLCFSLNSRELLNSTGLRYIGLMLSAAQVKIAFESCLEPIPEKVYSEACVHTTDEAVKACQKVGYPVMIKASWGGGGKGIRKVLVIWVKLLLVLMCSHSSSFVMQVHNDDEVRALFKQVQGEVPGSPIFVMKVASQV